MADGVKVNEGEDVTIYTDETASGQVQIIKLAVSANGDATLIGADANGLDVDVTRAPGTAADAGSLPALLCIIGGYDGTNTQAIATDSSGVLQADLLTLPALAAGNNNIGNVDIESIAAGSSKIGDVGISTRTSGGCSMNKNLDVDETEDAVKETAGQIYGFYFWNAASSAQYLKYYNATPANVTVGTTAPDLTFPLPPEAAGTINLPCPVAFSTAITIAATTGLADNNSGAPAANSVVVDTFYA